MYMYVCPQFCNYKLPDMNNPSALDNLLTAAISASEADLGLRVDVKQP